MAIAANFRRYQEALALQLPLPLRARLRMALGRPTRRAARAARAARSVLRRELLKRWTVWPEAKAKTAKRPAERELWQQLRLWLYTADQGLVLF